MAAPINNKSSLRCEAVSDPVFKYYRRGIWIYFGEFRDSLRDGILPPGSIWKIGAPWIEGAVDTIVQVVPHPDVTGREWDLGEWDSPAPQTLVDVTTGFSVDLPSLSRVGGGI